jgi:hypothetical protein
MWIKSRVTAARRGVPHLCMNSRLRLTNFYIGITPANNLLPLRLRPLPATLSLGVVVRLDATTLLRKAPSPGGRTIAPPGTKMMVTSKKWTSYRALAAAEGEIVASCQGGKSQIITSNNTNGVATTEAAANIPSLPKMSG